MVVDTGGVSHDEVGIDAEMAKQSMRHGRADLVVFIVDARTGLSSADEQFADYALVPTNPTFWSSTR